MNYLELINSFWRVEDSRGEPFSLAATRLYFSLLKLSNRQGWPPVLFKPNAAFYPLSDNTLIRARKELAAAGIIEYKSGDGRGRATAYIIKAAEIETFSRAKNEKAAKIETFEQSEKGDKKVAEKAAKIETQYKTINKNYKETANAVEKAGGLSPSPALIFSENREKNMERENPAKEKQAIQEGVTSEKAGNGAILNDNAESGGIPQPESLDALTAKIGKNKLARLFRDNSLPKLAEIETEKAAKGYTLDAQLFLRYCIESYIELPFPLAGWRNYYAQLEKATQL